jgi:hypothetical protein
MTSLEPLRVAVALSLVILAIVVSNASAIDLPKGWSHAQVNVVIKHKAHTLIYDRGAITRVAPRSLTLKERDGSVVLIPVSAAADVTFGGKATTLLTLRPGEFAMTVRDDGAPADQVKARKITAVD